MRAAEPFRRGACSNRPIDVTVRCSRRYAHVNCVGTGARGLTGAARVTPAHRPTAPGGRRGNATGSMAERCARWSRSPRQRPPAAVDNASMRVPDDGDATDGQRPHQFAAANLIRVVQGSWCPVSANPVAPRRAHFFWLKGGSHDRLFTGPVASAFWRKFPSAPATNDSTVTVRQCRRE